VQLDVRRLMEFHDCCGPLQPGLVWRMGALAMVSTNPVWGDYVPQFETLSPGPALPTPQPFDSWWTEPLWEDKQGEKFNRKGLVLALANKEGGAHVDPSLDEDYAARTRDNSLGITRAPTMYGPGVDLASPVPAAVRQIGHELVRSCQWWLPRALVKVGVGDDEIRRIIAPLDSYSTPPRDPGHNHAIEQAPPWITPQQ